MIVLAFLVLISGLIVAFVSSVGTETQTSKSYQSSLTVKQLATSAANLVTGQINDATKSVKIPGQNPAPGDRLAWASQPGMIRTWDDAGKGWKIFKLYSSREMVADFDADGRYSVQKELAKEAPDDWPTKTALFTDLNEPVVVGDPLGKIKRGSSQFRAAYPIVDPLAQNQVEGFRITKPPGYSGPSAPVPETYDPTVRTDRTKTSNPAPMPVSWMYVLKDGTLTVPTGSADNGLTATWEASEPAFKPSKANPIVGRFAFWTDDECSKINLNTASEPTPWDTPHAVTIQDLKYGKFQPAQKEYQRYPGHPFTTGLSPVFFPTRIPGVPDPPALSDTARAARNELLYGLIPRVAGGGSKSATLDVKSGISTIEPDQDRLFATFDEFLFQELRSPNLKTRKPINTDTDLAPLKLDIDKLRRARFFLTANSRAPEVNLFGQPRIALWPENSNANTRTAFDKLAAFCSTLGSGTASKPYYFQRSASTSPNADYDSVARNQLLYTYLQNLTSADIPGFGGSLKASWDKDRDQVLTEIVDYIRCTNLVDPQSGATKFAEKGQVTPLKIGTTKGFGRFHSISQFGIHFICDQDGPTGAGNALPAGKRGIEAAILFEPFSPSLGYAELNESISYEVTIGSGWSVDGTSLQFPATPIVVSGGNFGGIWHGRYWGGAQGIRGPIVRFGGGGYPLRGKRTEVSAANGKTTMEFSGGPLTVKVYSGTPPAPANLIQTFKINFPATTLPIPRLVASETTPFRGTGATTKEFWWTFATRYSSVQQCPHVPGAEYSDPKRRWGNTTGAAGFKTGGVFRLEDVVRTMVPVHGDLRLVAGMPDPSGLFVKGAYYDDSSRSFDHLFTEPQGPHMLYGFGNEPGLTSPLGSQLTPAIYHYARNPEITPGAGKLYNKWNDFDNGFAHVTDGPYINKPDEGNVADQNSSYPYFSWDFTAPTEVLFSPNRLVPSAGMLGSLPTGVLRGQPWQTLLFRPEPGHPGEGVGKSGAVPPAPPFTKPPDHLLMDLFWMPVIEPYAISEPFSTSGKINMNYEIAPFSYIRRATGMHAAMKSEEPLIIPNGASRIYKLWDHETNDWPNYPNGSKAQDSALGQDWDKLYNGKAPFDRLRQPIDAEKTLAQFDNRFANGDAFRSATEICRVHLVREDETLSPYTSGAFWPQNVVTGDNTRERPYTNLYAKLTTRSNAFTIHIRAQVLQPAGSGEAAWTSWKEGRDTVSGDYRGSTIVERYIDPADPSLVDFATNPNAVADAAYKFRIVATKKFTP